MTAARRGPNIDVDALRRERRARGGGGRAGGVIRRGRVLITAVTYGSASTQGRTYIIAYGPILVGVIDIIRGLALMDG